MAVAVPGVLIAPGKRHRPRAVAWTAAGVATASAVGTLLRSPPTTNGHRAGPAGGGPVTLTGGMLERSAADLDLPALIESAQDLRAAAARESLPMFDEYNRPYVEA